ncbi:TonB-dependent receptor [Robiginitalea sediminis]|uniref:TonB-dependent receptor n=1 Tax=Robiginitalea sediminis TaxID=1982593 RepID=UPI001E63F997|nr:TonB-dependent receptor [Robiginitalea sediminis]
MNRVRHLLLLVALALLSTSRLEAQQAEISGDYNQTLLGEVVPELEAQTGLKFFFLPEWVAGVEVSGSFSNTPVGEALNTLLEGTPLNAYLRLSEGRVYLLRNTLIYEELPDGFFPLETDSTPVTVSSRPRAQAPAPVFLPEAVREDTRALPIARIGKASEGQQRAAYLIRGQARNNQTGEPVADLAIRVGGTNRIAVTNTQGQYQLELPPGYHVLTATAMGIREMKREILLYGDGTLDFNLEEGVQQLTEVVVEADAARNVEQASTGSEQIGSEESKNIPLVLGERDILQVAKTLPGISSAGEGASGINVRGGKTDQNLVLLDDAVIYNPTHFFGIFQALNPFTTERVDIYKGAAPLEFGGRLASVFDIRSKDGNTQELSGEGSVGPVTANLALEIPVVKDKSSLVVGGRGAYADWILRSLDDESLSNSGASFFDGIVRYTDQLNENNRLETTAYYSRDAFSITSDSLYRYSNALASVRWDHRIGEKTGAVLFFGNSDYRFGIDYDGPSNTDFRLDYGINETQMKYRLRTEAGKGHTLDYGITGKYYSVSPGSREAGASGTAVAPIDIPREQAFEGALFLGDAFDLTDRLRLDVGVRLAFFAALGPGSQRTYAEGQPISEGTVRDTLNYGSLEAIKTYGGPEVRASVRYLLAEDFSVKASFNNAYQFVHTLSNNTTISPIDTWKLSDLNIRPQTGYQASLGFYKNFADNAYEVSLEGYYKRMDDVLDFKTGANLLLNPHVETQVLQGEGKAYGVEFLLKKEKGKLNGWLGYTYSRSFYRLDSEFRDERVNNGAFFPSNFDKPHDLSLIANYRLTRRYSFSMNFVYQTGRPVTYPIGTFRFNNADLVFYSDRNRFRIPDYYRLDLGINIEGNHKKDKLAHSFWTISVYNVLGRNNPYSVFFVTEGGEVKALQSSIFAIPVPSITYNFKF